MEWRPLIQTMHIVTCFVSLHFYLTKHNLLNEQKLEALCKGLDAKAWGLLFQGPFECIDVRMNVSVGLFRCTPMYNRDMHAKR